MLDFKTQAFIKCKIKSEEKMPSGISSCQTLNGDIFIVGGMVKGVVLRNTYKLHRKSFELEELQSMQTARYHVPICLVKDNFIIAAGGLASIKDKIAPTNLT